MISSGRHQLELQGMNGMRMNSLHRELSTVIRSGAQLKSGFLTEKCNWCEQQTKTYVASNGKILPVHQACYRKAAK